MQLLRSLFALSLLVFSSFGFANSSGILGLDHRINFDDSGIWSSSTQKTVEFGSALFVLGGAFYEGTDSRLGQTFWKSFDAMLLGDASALVAKKVFRRQRPIDGNNPDAFFKSKNDNSFPSGETTHIAAIVTPFIVEYRKDSPRVWLLAALPMYVGVARLKSQAHWQSDVLAAGLLGVGAGLMASQRDNPWSAEILPNSFSIGYKKNF